MLLPSRRMPYGLAYTLGRASGTLAARRVLREAGYTNTVVRRLDELLAQTDPFELAEGIDRYVHSLSGDEIRTLVLDARERMGNYYRTEFVRLLEETKGVAHPFESEVGVVAFCALVGQPWSDAALRSAFARFLKFNLRAAPLFGAPFCEAVLENVSGERTVAIGEEHASGVPRLAIAAAAAFALIAAGAMGEQYVLRAHAETLPVATAISPPPVAASAIRRQARPPHRTIAIATPSPAQTTAPATPAPAPPPAAAAPAPPAVVSTPPPVRVKRNIPTPPPAEGVSTVSAPAPTPTPEPSALDVSDMPDAYSDATPLPQASAPSAAVPGKVHVVTPTPAPAHHSWIVRSLYHLDPFKPRPRSTP